jgi:hypothetical protein
MTNEQHPDVRDGVEIDRNSLAESLEQAKFALWELQLTTHHPLITEALILLSCASDAAWGTRRAYLDRVPNPQIEWFDRHLENLGKRIAAFAPKDEAAL